MKKYAFLALLTGFLTVFAKTAEADFTFTAVGDYGASADTAKVLDGIGSSGAAFNLAIGDMSYNIISPESAWCDFVKSHVGQNFPFELVAGNHEDQSGLSTYGGDIQNFVLCLPNRISGIVGEYGKQYYFDYQNLARFILISPHLVLDPGQVFYNYIQNSSFYNWMVNAIDDARSKGIPWVVVAFHETCITMGEKEGCQSLVGIDLFSMLVAKKVDLIIYAHDHSYQRTKQLAFGSGCASFSLLGDGQIAYNQNCVPQNGQTISSYPKGGGSVVVISAAGGDSAYNISTSDPEAPYFLKWMGVNINESFGFAKFTVSPTKISAAFVPTTGSFSDSFEISGLSVSVVDILNLRSVLSQFNSVFNYNSVVGNFGK